MRTWELHDDELLTRSSDSNARTVSEAKSTDEQQPVLHLNVAALAVEEDACGVEKKNASPVVPLEAIAISVEDTAESHIVEHTPIPTSSINDPNEVVYLRTSRRTTFEQTRNGDEEVLPTRVEEIDTPNRTKRRRFITTIVIITGLLVAVICLIVFSQQNNTGALMHARRGDLI